MFLEDFDETAVLFCVIFRTWKYVTICRASCIDAAACCELGTSRHGIPLYINEN